MADDAGEVNEAAARGAEGPAAPVGWGAVPEEVTEDLPTLPPASRGSNIGLRWATFPLERPSSQVVPDDQYTPGPPTALLPVALDALQAAPEGDEAGDRDEAGPRPRRRRRVMLLLLTVVALVAAAVVVLVLGAGTTRAPRQKSVRSLAPRAAFELFLSDSAQAHQLLTAALSSACQPAAPASTARQALIAEVNRAVDLRRSVLSGIAADRRRLLAMDGGQSLVPDLSAATEMSLSADEGYEGWLEDLQATGCYGAPTNDLHYRAASESSLAATAAKHRLVGAWAGVASRYGLRNWTAGQL